MNHIPLNGHAAILVAPRGEAGAVPVAGHGVVRLVGAAASALG